MPWVVKKESPSVEEEKPAKKSNGNEGKAKGAPEGKGKKGKGDREGDKGSKKGKGKSDQDGWGEGYDYDGYSSSKRGDGKQGKGKGKGKEYASSYDHDYSDHNYRESHWRDGKGGRDEGPSSKGGGKGAKGKGKADDEGWKGSSKSGKKDSKGSSGHYGRSDSPEDFRRSERPSRGEDGAKGSKGGKKGGKGGKGRNESDSAPVPFDRSDDIRRQALETTGKYCQVKKHSSMGCAIVTMSSTQIRQAIVNQLVVGKESKVQCAGRELTMRPHTDKETGADIPTDIFVGWGRQSERTNPLSEEDLTEWFDEKHVQLANSSPMRPTLSTVPPSPSHSFSHQAPPTPPPAHVPKVGQILQSTATYAPQLAQQPQASPQQQPVQFPDQQYWINQHQQQQYAAQLAQQHQLQQYQQQQHLYAQQQYAMQQRQAQEQAKIAAGMAKPLPKPWAIKDPTTGSAVDTLGTNFQQREPPKPLAIIDPKTRSEAR